MFHSRELNNRINRIHERAGWTIRPRVCGDGAFPGDFLAGELDEIFLFFAELSLSFLFVGMFVIYLFIF